jgi:curved DNA-binding protein CbpA
VQKTHYDTLKVSRDAPIEVIRAAYRVLSQKYHPDRHPADLAAADTMGLLNKAYEVLSDPDRRRTYDAWIRQIEAESSHVPTSKAMASRPARVTSERETGDDAALLDRIALHLRQCGILYGSVVLLVLVGLVVALSVAPGPQLNSWVAVTPAPEDREAYIRRLAREVMLLPRMDRAKGSTAVPAAPDPAASPSDNSPASATERETPVEQVPSDDDVPRLNDTARPATHPGEEARSTPELPSASPSNEAELSSASQPIEPELPSVSLPKADTADRGASSSESQQGSTEGVAGQSNP